MNTGIVFAKLNKKINFRRNNIVFYYLPEYALSFYSCSFLFTVNSVIVPIKPYFSLRLDLATLLV